DSSVSTDTIFRESSAYSSTEESGSTLAEATPSLAAMCSTNHSCSFSAEGLSALVELGEGMLGALVAGAVRRGTSVSDGKEASTRWEAWAATHPTSSKLSRPPA